MPPIETSDRYDYAVLWVKIGDDAHGEPLIADPIELQVRWEDVTDEARKADSSLIGISDIAVTDRRIPIGSIMWNGRLEEWYGTGSAGPSVELVQVETYDRTPDLKGREVRHVVKMSYFRGSLPAHG